MREALTEREVLWGIAPHIVWPLRFLLPFHKKLRPAWLLRLGLLIYDNIGGRKALPPTRTVRLQDDPMGAPLKPEFRRGFEYSDCWVEDSRLVVLNAVSAVELGAEVLTRTACVSADRQDGLWDLVLRDEAGRQRRVRARSLVNAAGPWVSEVAGEVIRSNERTPVRLVQGSHIVVPRLYDHDGCYIFQNADKRIFFVIPYEEEFTLIGTTDQDYHGDPAEVHASPAEIEYLCRSASEYLRQPVTTDMVVWTYSGVRPLHGEGDGLAQKLTRDYVLKLDAPDKAAPLLSIFGGKITTFRRLSEAALRDLAPHLPAASRRAEGWTGHEPLPGGDFPMTGYAEQVRKLQAAYPFLAPRHARRLVRAYGSRAERILAGARSLADLGRSFGADLTEAELRYLVQSEWARRAADVVWRRSKLGLRLTAAQIRAIDEAIGAMAAQEAVA